MKAAEHYFPVMLFILLYKLVLTFDCFDGVQSVTFKGKVLSNIFFSAVLYCCAVLGGSNFESMQSNSCVLS